MACNYVSYNRGSSRLLKVTPSIAPTSMYNASPTPTATPATVLEKRRHARTRTHRHTMHTDSNTSRNDVYARYARMPAAPDTPAAARVTLTAAPSVTPASQATIISIRPQLCRLQERLQQHPPLCQRQYQKHKLQSHQCPQISQRQSRFCLAATEQPGDNPG